MTVRIDLKETSQALIFENVINTYTKGPLYCIYSGGLVTKIPIENIWRIVENYGKSASRP